MKLTQLNVTSPFRYLWLKRVDGVDLSQHCARCLLGPYDRHIKGGVTEAHDLELGDGVYYLCGVSSSFKYELNYHLAVVPCAGSTVVDDHNGVHVVIEDARRVSFGPEDINADDPHCSVKALCTCRNWQFAHHYAASQRDGKPL